jgi:hypothetical protein
VIEDSEPLIRPARRDDAEAPARMHREFAEFYLRLGPADLRLPDEDGLVEFIQTDVEPGPDAVARVAELGGEPAVRSGRDSSSRATTRATR